MSKSIVKKTHEKPAVLNQNPPNSGPLVPRSDRFLEVQNGERAVAPLDAQYSDLLKAPDKPTFDFKQQLLPLAVILLFSFVLVALYSFSNSKSGPGEGRGVAGDLNDLSNGRFIKQAADYSEEKVCVDHPDGTQTCTTKTKLRREFR